MSNYGRNGRYHYHCSRSYYNHARIERIVQFYREHPVVFAVVCGILSIGFLATGTLYLVTAKESNNNIAWGVVFLACAVVTGGVSIGIIATSHKYTKYKTVYVPNDINSIYKPVDAEAKSEEENNNKSNESNYY